MAGDVTRLQIMYGPAGERRLDEWEASWLPGYEGSVPVRIGNAASGQFQLDVYGEVMSALYASAHATGVQSQAAWALQTQLVGFLEKGWTEPDDGIWEVRGPRRHFTHSKVMAWVAIDRAVRTLEEWPDLGGRWRSGGCCATRSSPRCARRGSTRRSVPSPSTTARTSSMPASS